ncbi:DUF308 domain-containing protein, partial [Ruminococcaceae bacterium OttesenSCG-928-A16]|nr:DUF308 domain-containing protein [Ruminococcaceae bacterium OttesenSCG-928-A16]
LGGFAIVMGLVRIASFFVRDVTERILHGDFATGIVMVAIGIFLFTNPDFLWRLLPIIIGFTILFDSIIKLQNSFAMRQMEFPAWWVYSVVSVITAVLGILLIVGVFGDNILIYYLGGVLIADGVINIVVVLTLSIVTGRVKRTVKKAVQNAKDASEKESYTEVYLAGEEPEKPTLTVDDTEEKNS